MFRWKNKQLNSIENAKNLRNIGSYVVLLLAVGATAFFGVVGPSMRSGNSLTGGPAAKVNGEVVTEDEFRRAYTNLMRRMQGQYGESFDPTVFELAHRTMENLIDERVLYVTSLKLGLKASDEEIVKVLNDADIFKDDGGKFSEEKFKNFLKGNRYSEATLMEEIRRNLTVQKLREFIARTSYVSEKSAELDYKLNETKLDVEFVKFDPATIQYEAPAADIEKFAADAKNKDKIKDYYNKHTTEFKEPARIHARHILVGYKGARNADASVGNRTKDDAKKRAEAALARVKAAGADFAKLANELTDDPSGKSKGGDLGFFTKESMVKEFSDAAFALKPGEISGIVESPFGFHIIKLEEIKPAKDQSLEASTHYIAGRLLAQEQKPKILEERVQSVLKELKENRDPAPLLKTYGLAWKATGPFAPSAYSVPELGGDAELKDKLFTLNDTKKFYPEALDISGAKAIVRLKSRKEADVAGLTPEKKEELTESESYSQGYALLSAIEKNAKTSMEKSGRISRNDKYLAIDRHAPQGGQGAAPSDDEGG